MKRLLEIDTFRGLLLLIMVINHTPSPLREVTTQPLGFVSAAEAFVFVSAYLCGLIFSRKLKSSGLPELKRLTRRRIRQIYLNHVLVLLFCFAVVGQLLGHQAPFYNMLHPYLPDHWCYLILTLQLGVLLYLSLFLDRFSNNNSGDNAAAPPLRG